jgi:hypothetical protein
VRAFEVGGIELWQGYVPRYYVALFPSCMLHITQPQGFSEIAELSQLQPCFLTEGAKSLYSKRTEQVLGHFGIHSL